MRTLIRSRIRSRWRPARVLDLEGDGPHRDELARLPGPWEVRLGVAAQTAGEDLLERRPLLVRCVGVEVEDPRPRRARLVVAVADCHRDRQARQIDLVHRAVLDDPREDAHALTVRRAAAGPAVDPPAGADRVAVTGLEVRAADVPAHGTSTILPKTSPSASASSPRRASASGSVSSISGRTPRRREELRQALELLARPHRRAEHGDLAEEDVRELGGRRVAGGRARDDDRAAVLDRADRVPPRRPAHGLHDRVDPRREPRARLEGELGARGRAPAGASPPTGSSPRRADRRPRRAGSARSRRRHPRPARARSRPARRAPRVNSIRYAVSHAVGRQAASSNESAGGFGTRFRRGTATRSASVPGIELREERALGVERLVAVPAGARDHAVDDHLVALLVDAGGVAAEDHRQPFRGQSDPLQRPEIVVVERRRPDLDERPAFRAARARAGLRPRGPRAARTPTGGRRPPPATTRPPRARAAPARPRAGRPSRRGRRAPRAPRPPRARTRRSARAPRRARPRSGRSRG